MDTINYKKICENLLKGLSPRFAEVISKRYGLDGSERKTLEAVGQVYGITRERVRQITEEAFSKMRPKIKDYQPAFKSLNDYLKSFGDLKKEDSLLLDLGGKNYQNHVYFLMTLSSDFQKLAEDDNFYSFWTRSKDAILSAKKTVALVLNKLKSKKELLTLDKLYNVQKADFAKIGVKKEAFNSYIEASKQIEGNADGEIGMVDWLEINPKGIKDKAYLIFKKQGKPLHFTDVAVLIEKSPYSAQKKVHLATVHNELIKDSRFVLIGRGMYALKEWGYEPGVVKDLIAKILKDSKPLTKQELIDKVLKQRMIKASTIWLNLQDKDSFLKNEQGRYTIRES